MIRTTLIALMLAIMGLATAMAAPSPALDQAAKDYNEELYTKALEAYLTQAKTDSVSADLYYNMGNTYYRLKDNAHAILYYERALRLDPGHSDARYNVHFVRTRAGISDDQASNILSIWIEAAMSRLSTNAWAVIALLAFLLMLAALSAYIFMDQVMWRKVGFFGAIVALTITVVSLLCAWRMHDRAVAHNQAIVMTAGATLSTSPRTAKDKSEVAFDLPAGHKVTLNDKVTTAGTVWYHVTVAGRQAWVAASDIEII